MGVAANLEGQRGFGCPKVPLAWHHWDWGWREKGVQDKGLASEEDARYRRAGAAAAEAGRIGVLAGGETVEGKGDTERDGKGTAPWAEDKRKRA